MATNNDVLKTDGVTLEKVEFVALCAGLGVAMTIGTPQNAINRAETLWDLLHERYNDPSDEQLCDALLSTLLAWPHLEEEE